ncbi:hypothetical protein OnM2_037031 [Erysiphe neolycopersici]|uniref:Uncharacterized protein n=1 Tax=Erysiphe neolycopersici TaxID=212602 RepID=A0A420HWW0_9PEZI|nr:hypothetical protein OnM2_037031 [Erysiphe neolycopersici]
MSRPMQKTFYRKAKPITHDIHRHCHILFDEGLYINALDFLNNIITTGTARSDNHNRLALTPKPFHIELASILLIHPRYTNQAVLDEEYSQIASRSLNFLRNVLSILGPLHANLVEAFSFSIVTKSNNLLRNKKDYTFLASTDEDELCLNDFDSEGEKDTDLKCFIANQGRTSRCATDFWHLVGWSFNCSIKYPKRWKYLKIWLEYMLDVLETDFSEREHFESADNGIKEAQESKLTSQSIILCYLSHCHGNSSAVRRIMKSIFANGDKDSLKTFPQVFPDETKTPKYFDRQELKNKHFNPFEANVLNADFENEPHNFELLPTFKLEEDKDNVQASTHTYGSWMGSTEAINLRQRLLTLLSTVAKSSPKNFIAHNDLLVLIYDFIRPLPIPIFTLFISSSKSSFISETLHTSLCQIFLSRLLPKSAPSPKTTIILKNIEIDDPQYLLMFEECYLPFAAFTSSSHDNAQVSIVLENLLRLFLRKHKCSLTHTFERTLKCGIIAREEGIIQQRKKRGSNKVSCTIDEDNEWLKASSFRLLNLLTWSNVTGKKKAGKD